MNRRRRGGILSWCWFLSRILRVNSLFSVAVDSDGKLATTGGHVKAGTTSVEGIIEEVEEELGLSLKPSDLQVYYSGREDSSRVFFDDYYARVDVDLEDLKLQDDEVDEALWMTADEICAAIESGEFLSNHVDEFERLMAWLEKP